MKLNPVPFLVLSLWATLEMRAASPGLSLESAVACALTNNANLAAARFRVDEAIARGGSAGRWSNPELETEFKPNVRGREGSLSLGFSQRFPLTSRLRLEKAVSRSEVAVAAAEVHDAERRLALEVRTTAIRLAAAREQIGLVQHQVENSREWTATVRRSAAAGEGTELEALQLELEAAQLQTRRQQLEAEALEWSNELRSLLGLPGASELELSVELAPPAKAGPPKSGAVRSDLEAVQARLATANQAIELARTRRWEDGTFGLFGEVERSEDAPKGLETDGFVGIRFSVPLPVWNDHGGRVTEAATVAARIEKEADALALRIRSEIAAARLQHSAAAERVASLQTDLLPKAKALEERLTHLHAQGQAPFTDVLRAREQRLQLESSELEARRDYHLAHARLLAATGQILDPQP